MLLANPALACCITEAIGDGWITDLGELAELEPLADDRARDAIRNAKREEARSLRSGCDRPWRDRRSGRDLRQPGQADLRVQAAKLLNGLRGRATTAPAEPRPRDGAAHVLFAGQAAPAYHLAKVIIKFLNSLASTIDGDPAVRGRLKVSVPAGILRVARRAADPRERRLQPDLDRGLRGERHEQQ